MPGSTYQFDDFELNCAQFQLSRKGRRLRLERKPMELLILLASREGELVSRTDIAEKLWSSDVFVDTDHGINTAIRKLRYLLRDDPDSPRYIETVTGLGYRFIAQVTRAQRELLGTPQNAEVVPQPVPDVQELPEPRSQRVKTQPQAEPPVPFPITTSKRDRTFWIGTLICALLLVGAVVKFAPNTVVARLFHRNVSPVITSIAVLPLDNLSGDSNQEYLADGMTDELITTLAKASTLHVVSRTSVMQYKRARKPLPEIAGALNVKGILEGSLTRTGDHVHVTLQLINADTDVHLWAESYDRSANDILSIPSEAARDIARHLHSAVSVSQKSRYVSPAAYDAYLHGRYLWYAGWQQNEKAGDYFKRAIQLQPDYALAWAGLATYYGQGAITGDFNPKNSLALFESAAAKAVELDDSLPEAHLAMSGAAFMNRWDFDWAQRELNRALELNPRFALAYDLDARELTVLNRHAEAIEAEKKALDLEPTSHPWHMLEVLALARQYDAAILDGKQRLESNPRDAGLYYMMMDTYRRKGMYKEAVDAVLKLNEVTNNQKEIVALHNACSQYGYKGALIHRQLAAAQEAAKRGYLSPVDFAALYAQMGDRERTISLLEQGFREHSPRLLWIQTEPAFDFLHSDPRYRSLILRIHLPQAN